MSKSDPEATRKSLAERYAHITEDELRGLADNAGSLTDLAKGVLKAELFRRGLAVELRDPSVIDERHPSLVTLRKFRDLPAALLAKSILDSAEIECFLCDENVIRMDWLWSNALGGIRLLVKEEDASVALELLDQKPMEKFATGTGEFRQPRCPSVTPWTSPSGGTGKRLSYVTVALGVPLPVKGGGWKCNSCGHAWHDSEGLDAQVAPR